MTENKDNAYVAELKSLLQDKFFVALLGVSVVIIGISTVYSFIKPKSGEIPEMAQSTQQESPTEAVALEKYEGLEGLETKDGKPKDTLVITQPESLFGALKAAAKDFMEKLPSPLAETTPTPQMENPSKPVQGGEYVIAQGDSLWSIAEKVYGSGYNYTDIAMANNLQNPDIISEGVKIVLPTVESKSPTGGQIAGGGTVSMPKFDTYTVKEGDNLWTIADMAFSDPYMWSEIARINMLAMPDVINPGQVLRMK